MKLKLSQITAHSDLQARAASNTEVVNDYAEIFDQLPPAVVFYDGKTYWLADGFHRYAAACQLQHKTFEVEVHEGSKRDAQLYAVKANHSHGLRRTNADKRRAVEILLADEEWSQWSNVVIAAAANVSATFVANLRPSGEEKRKGADGKMRPAKIRPKIEAYDDTDYEDVDTDEDAEQVDNPKEKQPTKKEQLAKLRSVALQHLRAAMRAIDEMNHLQKSPIHKKIEGLNIQLQDEVSNGWK